VSVKVLTDLFETTLRIQIELTAQLEISPSVMWFS